MSTISEATLPPVISFTSSTALRSAGIHISVSSACLNFVAASVERPNAIAVLLILFLSKFADSKMILFVFLSTLVSLPPITPAIAIGLILSAITIILSLRSWILLSKPSIFSLSLAILMLIVALGLSAGLLLIILS